MRGRRCGMFKGGEKIDFWSERRMHLDYDATTATSHLRRGISEEAEAPRHLTHHLLPHPSAFGASPRLARPIDRLA
jgi:hypothetical protein